MSSNLNGTRHNLFHHLTSSRDAGAQVTSLTDGSLGCKETKEIDHHGFGSHNETDFDLHMGRNDLK